jgi:hypothetical protein
MASLTRGTTFVDGVANDVTAAKLSALVDNATPTSGFIQDRTAETITATNDTLLIGDASDSNNLKRITVANFAQTLPTAKVTTGTIDTGTFGTTTSTAATITTGTIPTLTSITKITSGTGTAAAPAISPTGDTNTGIFFPDADTIAFSEGGTEGMRIDSSGNVGIGTTSPDARLEIEGVGSTASNPSTTSSIDATIGIRSGIGSGNGGMLMLGANQGYFSAIKGFLTNGASNPTGDLLFCTRKAITDTTLTEAMRIDESGNVGIGITNPSRQLSVSGASAALGITSTATGGNTVSIDPATTANSNTAQIDCSGANALRFNTNSAERLRIDSSGNVGIGVTSPTSKLVVDGTVTLRANSTEGGQIQLLNPDNSTIGLTMDVSTGSNVGRIISASTTSTLALGQLAGTGGIITAHTASTERLRIDASGNVSIGTATALSKLHVHGDLTMSNATTAVTASTSTITPPATVAGYLTVSINGTSRKIAYYAT